MAGEELSRPIGQGRRAPGADDAAVLRTRLGELAPAVRRYLFGLCGDWDEAEDAAQEALLRAWRGLGRFDGRAELGTWVFAIARNHWLDRLRRRRARPAEQVTDGTYIESRGDPPAAALERGELAEIVRRALDRLPPEQREALALRESEGLKFDQIAEMLDVPTSTVKSRVRYALAKLADELRSHRREATR